jgi:hypothetical protein
MGRGDEPREVPTLRRDLAVGREVGDWQLMQVKPPHCRTQQRRHSQNRDRGISGPAPAYRKPTKRQQRWCQDKGFQMTERCDTEEEPCRPQPCVLVVEVSQGHGEVGQDGDVGQGVVLDVTKEHQHPAAGE